MTTSAMGRKINRYLVCANAEAFPDMEGTEGTSLEEDEAFSYDAFVWIW